METLETNSLNTDILERIGLLVDKIENLWHAMHLPMPADFHLSQMKSELKAVIAELKSIHQAGGGEPDTWEDE